MSNIKELVQIMREELNFSHVVDGKKLSHVVKGFVKNKVEEKLNWLIEHEDEIDDDIRSFLIQPRLDVILVGNNPASATYVRNKRKACEEVGIACVVHEFPESISQDTLLEEIRRLNKEERVHGLFVQFPLPNHIDESMIIDEINYDKDVDGFTSFSTRGTYDGNIYQDNYLLPCTPLGVACTLEALDLPKGSHVVIIGRSHVVGAPLSRMLLNLDYTVTVCHSKTKSLKEITKNADIIISAVGRVGMVTEEMVKEGATVMDVGINYIEVDGKRKLVGDVDYDNIKNKAKHITPVPGGVGPMTVAFLMYNVYRAWSELVDEQIYLSEVL